jgi:hypothetical protein
VSPIPASRGGAELQGHPTRRDATLAHAARGWPVFPVHSIEPGGRCTCGKPECRSPGKHPRTSHGVLDASTDSEVIGKWWRRWPTANIGLATGEGSSLVDVDGEEGHHALLDLQRRHGRLPETLWVRPPRGGWHAYFAPPGEHVSNSAGKLGVGIDVRGDGGYAIAPPSVGVNSQPYRWAVRNPIAPLPAWLLDHLRPPCSTVRQSP